MSDTAQSGYCLLTRQTAWGTPATTLGAFGLRLTSMGISGQADRLDDDDEIGGGRARQSSSATLGYFHVAGSLEGLFRPKAFGLLLLAAGFATGGAPTQDATTGAYTHTFTPSDTLTPLTVETLWGKVTDGLVRRFSDVLVDELELSLDANGKVTFSASCVGRAEEVQGAPSVPTFETDPVANYAGSAAVLDGLGTYRFESMSWKIANGLSDDETVIGSRSLDDVTPGSREVTIGATLKAGSNTPQITGLYRAAVYGDPAATEPQGADPYHSSAALTFGSSRLIGTSTTKRYGLTATMPDVVLNGFPLEASGSDRLSADIEGTAYAGASPEVTVTLQNGFSTDYALATG